jgi:ABC-2 type transport system permease protein
LGTLIAAFARDANQANIIGSVVTLFFAALGGSFVPAQSFPAWLQAASKITINRWGMDGFTDLAMRGLGLSAVLLEVAVLAGIGLILFFLALFQFHRRISR